VAAGLLRDMAAAQGSPQKTFGYKRAADVVLTLDRPIAALVRRDGSLEKTFGLGPASNRIILDVLQTGTSAAVEQAVAASPKAAEIGKRQALRHAFLSRAAVLTVLQESALAGPTLRDYRGDLQMHSDWSGGAATAADMAAGCLARGYEFAALTDHSHGLKIASGMSMADAAAQHEAIDAINGVMGRLFRMIKGIEANIGPEGDLDLSPDEAARFELVLAAPHSRLRSADDQTARLLRAVGTPHVHVLAHPRGRMMDARAGIVADWDAVFAAAADNGVAVELDGDPFRQDLDYTIAIRAREAGCLFAVSSDAHSVDQLAYVETALAHARLAAIPPDRIVNCWARDRLLAWLEGARGR
jgi:histidinol phosphatase-like PHP family hydrolase